MIPLQSSDQPPDRSAAPRAGTSVRRTYQQDHATWLADRRRLVTRNIGWTVGGAALLGAYAGWRTQIAGTKFGYFFGVVFGLLIVLAFFDVAFRQPSGLVQTRLRAAGQGATAKLLRPLEHRGFTVLHDRALPYSDLGGASVDVDHLVVGQSGVYLIGSRNWMDGPPARIAGNALYHGAEPQAEMLRQLRRDADEVGRALAGGLDDGFDQGLAAISVTPVLAVHAQELSGTPRLIEGVAVLRAEQLWAVLERDVRSWSSAMANRIATTADLTFPPRPS